MNGTIVTDIRKLIYDAIYRNVQFNMGAELQVGLSTTIPTIDGLNFSEPPASAAYSRIDTGIQDWTLPDANAGGTNAIQLVFPTASADWGQIIYAGIFLNEAGSSQLVTRRYFPTSYRNYNITLVPILYYKLGTPKYIYFGMTPSFDIGQLRFGPWGT